MIRIVKKSQVGGKLVAPTSKSALQRLIVASMLSDGESNIYYNLMSEDSEAVLGISKAIGAKVSICDGYLSILGGFKNPSEKLYVGESGLGLRMLLPILASTNYEFEVSGKGSLLMRPLGYVVDSLKSAGVSIVCENDSLPVKLQGPISTNQVIIDGSIGSQLVTGYLMAAPLLNRDIEIIVDNLKSKPYIDLTISILESFGIEVINHSYQRYEIKKGQKYCATDIKAEGDWSGAAFPLVAAAISGSIELLDIDINSTQGDKAILNVIKSCGAKVYESNNSIKVSKNVLNAFEFDATDVPDLFPPLVALAINCKGKSVIKGVSRLKHKESDRGYTLQNEFQKLGANILIDNDLMIIEGSSLKGNKVSSHNDHRIAMALAIAAINADGEVEIENSDAVGKSWPDFFEKMKDIGMDVNG
jgi:3-phosphoshikimate 1-carboxyvinyltransferase